MYTFNNKAVYITIHQSKLFMKNITNLLFQVYCSQNRRASPSHEEINGIWLGP